MSNFYRLIAKESEKLHGITTDYPLLEFLAKVEWALSIKNTYFNKVKDFINDRELFAQVLKKEKPFPDFYCSSEIEKFVNFLIEVTKAIKKDKEDKAKIEKLRRLESLKKEVKQLETELYGK